MSKIIWKEIPPEAHIPRDGRIAVPKNLTHYTKIGDVNICKSKTHVRVNLPLTGCLMMVTPKKGQTLDQVAKIAARRVQAEVDILAERFQRGLFKSCMK